MNPLEAGRMSPKNARMNPVDGVVAWSPVKSIGFTTHAVMAIIVGYLMNSHPRQILSARAAATQTKPHARLRPRPIVFFDEP